LNANKSTFMILFKKFGWGGCERGLSTSETVSFQSSLPAA
jgi:hypothetical protein